MVDIYRHCSSGSCCAVRTLDCYCVHVNSCLWELNFHYFGILFLIGPSTFLLLCIPPQVGMNTTTRTEFHVTHKSTMSLFKLCTLQASHLTVCLFMCQLMLASTIINYAILFLIIYLFQFAIISIH